LAAEAKGLQVMEILSYGDGYISPTDAYNFMHDQALRLKGHVWMFEFTNEPNYPGTPWTTDGTAFTGGKRYGQSLIQAYLGMKAGNPDAIMIAGALSSMGAHNEWITNWVKGIYAAGAHGGHGFDVFSMHLYEEPNDIGNDWNCWCWAFYPNQYTNNTCVRDIMNANGDSDIPIISTETGIPSINWQSGAPVVDSVYNEANQAVVVGHDFDHLFNVHDIASFAIFTMADDTMQFKDASGNVAPDGYGLIYWPFKSGVKPAWYVYQQRATQGY
jgi:hypothetical protein